MPVTFAAGMVARSRWFGAVGDGVTDDRAAVQAADDALWQGGVLLVGAGYFAVASVGRSNNVGEVCGLWYTNDASAGAHVPAPNARPNKVWRGEGYYRTIIKCSNALLVTNLAAIYANGEGFRVEDMSFNVESDGNAKHIRCLQLQGNGVEYRGIATGGGILGLHLFYASNFVDGAGSWDEYSRVGLRLEECTAITLNLPQPLSNDVAQIEVYNSAGSALPTGQQYAPIKLIGAAPMNGANEGTCVSVNIAPASKVGLELVAASLGSNNLQAGLGGGYNLTITQCYSFTMTGGALWHSKYGSTVGAGLYKFVGVDMTDIGMVRSDADFAVRALDIGNYAYVTIDDCLFLDIAGHAVRTRGAETRVLNSRFFNVAVGHYTAAGATRLAPISAVTGDAVIEWHPQSVADVLVVEGNHFYSPGGTNAGRSAVHVNVSAGNGIAVPGARKFRLAGNTMDAGSFQYPLRLTGVSELQKNAWVIEGDALAADTPIEVPSCLDADAPAGRLFQSLTTANALKWKRADGTLRTIPDDV
jgi:hypothetical protein